MYPELTSQRILVTGWVEGEKLTESKAKDVRQLCSTLLNCYLIQLLETGLLHADPHPGNLMRTPDGEPRRVGALLGCGVLPVWTCSVHAGCPHGLCLTWRPAAVRW